MDEASGIVGFARRRFETGWSRRSERCGEAKVRRASGLLRTGTEHNPDVRARDKLAGSPYIVQRSNEYC